MGPNRFLRHFTGDVASPGASAQATADYQGGFSTGPGWRDRRYGHLRTQPALDGSLILVKSRPWAPPGAASAAQAYRSVGAAF